SDTITVDRSAVDVQMTKPFAPDALRNTVKHLIGGAVEVVADSGEFYRSSMIQLDGESAARTVSVEFRSVPSVRVSDIGRALRQPRPRRGLARQSAFVLSRGGER